MPRTMGHVFRGRTGSRVKPGMTNLEPGKTNFWAGMARVLRVFHFSYGRPLESAAVVAAINAGASSISVVCQNDGPWTIWLRVA